MRIISHSVFTSVCCHILADGCGIVLDLGESNSFPQIQWFWRGTHQLNSNLPQQFLSLELPLYHTPIVSRCRRTNPKHSLVWFSIDGLSYSESAQRGFVLHNYRACDSRTRVCLASSSAIVKEIWWRQRPPMWAKGERGRAITPLCLPWVSEGCCRPEREQRRRAPPAGPSTSLSVCLPACLSVSPDVLYEVTVTGRRAWGSADTARCKSPWPSCTTHAVQTGSTPACVLSCQVADILI